MNRLSARTANGEFGLLIESEPWNAIGRVCLAANDRETGGILVGRYTTDRTTAVVLEVTDAPPDSNRGRSTFVRGVAGLSEMLRRRWNTKDRSYYVGEWHYHPATIVQPSSDDIQEMARIATARNYRCREPVLVIVGRPPDGGGRRPVRAFVFPDGQGVEMQVDESLLDASVDDLS